MTIKLNCNTANILDNTLEKGVRKLLYECKKEETYNHCTLKSNPSKYDMSLFIADKLAWDQENVPPFYNEVEKALSISLEKTSLTYINYIIDNNIILCPHKWILDAKKYLENIVGRNI